MPKIYGLKCEYEREPFAVDVDKPRFSWKIESQGYNVVQVAYHLQVYLDSGNLSGGELVWDTGYVRSDESVFIEYNGQELKENGRYRWRVKVLTESEDAENEYAWSDFAYFEKALKKGHWKAPFISSRISDSGPVYLRRSFVLEETVETARIYATALGMYELWINGERAGRDVLRPGWTNYRKRLAYQTYDASNMLKKGENVIGAVLAEGWYAGDLTWLDERNFYGDTIALSLQLRLQYKNGDFYCLNTDREWKSSAGPVLYSQLYHGEVYDARLEQEGWHRAGFDSSSWSQVNILPYDGKTIIAQDGPPVVKKEILKVKEVITTPKGETVLDFGQNISGWIKFIVNGNSGDRVRLKHAEILDKDGNFYDENMRSARNTIEYILKGKENETFEPHFTFQGFRYVKLVEYPGAVSGENFEAQVIHSDMDSALEFESSHQLLNKLHSNILWGWKGNSVDIPTDCPQRDERLGWTGDAQVFVGTASYLMNVNHFFRKWLRDLSSEQRSDGGVPYVIPGVLTSVAGKEKNLKDTHSSTGWGDAAVICPWTIYWHYKDKRLLSEQYPSMAAWIEHIRNRAENGLLWKDGFHFADWVALDAEEGSYFGATPTDLVATAYYAYSTSLQVKAARALGKDKEAEEYGKLYDRIVLAFQKEYFTQSGRLKARTQTGHVLALVLNLVPDEYRTACVQDLCALIEEHTGHLTTGFLGTPWILRALSENGHIEDAYQLLLKEDYPSWLFQIHMGATTVWEHWDGMKSDGTLWSPDMNSFNHYAYGAVGEWIYKNIGGMYAHPEDGQGWKHTVFRPLPGGGITGCRMKYISPYGIHSIVWSLHDGCYSAEVVIPPNTRGTIVIPGAPELIDVKPDLTFTNIGGRSTACTGSGTFRISCSYANDGE